MGQLFSQSTENAGINMATGTTNDDPHLRSSSVRSNRRSRFRDNPIGCGVRTINRYNHEQAVSRFRTVGYNKTINKWT